MEIRFVGCRLRPRTPLTIPADPDLSNPTRSRWERPLDTIRKFEQQIDGEYKRGSPVVILFSTNTSRFRPRIQWLHKPEE